MDTINANLQTLATDAGATYVDHDPFFKISDGIPNDGYFLDDGLHLNRKGTNRLCSNLKIVADPKVKGQYCKPSKNSVGRDGTSGAAKHRQGSYRDNNRDDQGEWKTVQGRRSHRRWTTQTSTSSINDGDRHHRTCWNCGESNHISKNCKHSRKLDCHMCGQLGHIVAGRLLNGLAVRFHVSLLCASCELKFFTGCSLGHQSLRGHHPPSGHQEIYKYEGKRHEIS